LIFRHVFKINLSPCGDSSSVGARLAIFKGPSCDEATCLESATDYGCGSLDERSGVTWIATEDVQYFVFVYGFEGSGDFVLNLIQLAPTPAPSASPTGAPTAIFFNSPTTTLTPTKSLQPSSGDCSLQISVTCTITGYEMDCSDFEFNIEDQYVDYSAAPWFFPLYQTGSFSVKIAFYVTVSVTENVGRTVVLQNLTSVTNYAGTIDLSDQVAGVSLGPGEFYGITLEGNIDISIRRDYTASHYVEATDANGDLCEGFGETSHVIGENVGEIPTMSPTSSLEPTPLLDEEGACDISAQLSCDGCVGNRPNSTVCMSEHPTTLWFQRTAKPCNESTYSGRFVTCRDYNVTSLFLASDSFTAVHIEDKTNGRPVFAGYFIDGNPVRFDLYNDTKATEVIRITISDINYVEGLDSQLALGKSPGKPIQVVEMGVNCENELNDISLLTHYGALQLVGFETPLQGVQRAFDNARFQLTVANRGNSPAQITALSTSIPDLDTEYDLYGESAVGRTISVDREETWLWGYGVDLVDYPTRRPLTVQIEAVNPLSGLSCSAFVALALPY